MRNVFDLEHIFVAPGTQMHSSYFMYGNRGDACMHSASLTEGSGTPAMTVTVFGVRAIHITTAKLYNETGITDLAILN